MADLWDICDRYCGVVADLWDICDRNCGVVADLWDSYVGYLGKAVYLWNSIMSYFRSGQSLRFLLWCSGWSLEFLLENIVVILHLKCITIYSCQNVD